MNYSRTVKPRLHHTLLRVIEVPIRKGLVVMEGEVGNPTFWAIGFVSRLSDGKGVVPELCQFGVQHSMITQGSNHAP